MTVTKRTRYEVLRRDNHQCRYCGASAPKAHITIDHVTPISLGGSDDPANLVAACADCNAGKASSNPDAPLVATVADDALRWAAAVRVVAARRLAELEASNATTAPFLEHWNTVDRTGRAPLPSDWRSSVTRWLSLGLPMQVLLEGIDIAMGRTSVPTGQKFAYCAGVAWRKIEEIRTEAAAEYSAAAGKTRASKCESCGEALDDKGLCGYANVDSAGACFFHHYDDEATSGQDVNHAGCCANQIRLFEWADDAYRRGWWAAQSRSYYRDVVAHVIDGIWPEPPDISSADPSLPPYQGRGSQAEADAHYEAWEKRRPQAVVYRTRPLPRLEPTDHDARLPQ